MDQDDSTNPEGSGPSKQRKFRKPRKPSKDRLERIAFHYLERFATSSANLRSVLQRRVWRAARFHDVDEDEARGWINEVVEKMERLGLVDDQAYASMKARNMNGRGKGRRAVTASLKAKGVGDDDIEQAFETLKDEEGPSFELKAAARLVRRRKLGPMRPEDLRRDFRDKDMGALARAGFDLDIARRVLALDDREALEELIDQLDHEG